MSVKIENRQKLDKHHACCIDAYERAGTWTHVLMLGFVLGCVFDSVSRAIVVLCDVLTDCSCIQDYREMSYSWLRFWRADQVHYRLGWNYSLSDIRCNHATPAGDTGKTARMASRKLFSTSTKQISLPTVGENAHEQSWSHSQPYTFQKEIVLDSSFYANPNAYPPEKKCFATVENDRSNAKNKNEVLLSLASNARKLPKKRRWHLVISL